MYAKQRRFKRGTKNVLFVQFWALSLKKYCRIWNQHLRISQNAKFYQKIKIFKFGTKKSLFSTFSDQTLKKNYIWNQHPQTCKKVSRAKQNVWILELWMPYLCNLGCNFEKFRVKIKTLKFETKNVLLSIFTLKIWKNDCHIWNQHPRICRNAKNCAKQKNKINFGTKIALFGFITFEISIFEFAKMESFMQC